MVKLAASVVLASALASSALAQGAYSSYGEDLSARDVSAQNGLFGRAAIKVLNELYNREELSDLFGRDMDELDLRDLAELIERDAGAAHAGAPAPTPVVPAQATDAGTPQPTAATATAAAPSAVPSAAAPLLISPNFLSLFVANLASLLSGHGSAATPAAAASAAGAKPSGGAPSAAAPAATPAGGASAGGPPGGSASSGGASAGGPPQGPAPADGSSSASGGAAAQVEPRYWSYEEPIERSLNYADQFEELVERGFYEDEDFEVRDYDDFEDVFERREIGSEWDERVYRRALDMLLEELD